MTKNTILLRKCIKTILNDICVDPYPTDLTRRGNHFFDEADGINFTRADSFPKGYLQAAPDTAPIKGDFGKTGWNKKYGTIDIYYYVKEKTNYVVGSDTYRNQDYAAYMINQIYNTLLDNSLIGSDYHLFANSFSASEPIQKINVGNFLLWQGSMSVTYYWMEQYGN